MIQRRCLISLFFLLVCSSQAQAQFDQHFGVFTGTIVVFDQKNDQYTIHNEERAHTPFTPFSTFKIPNSLIALETGVVPDIESTLTWDKGSYPEEDWWPENWVEQHNLKSAIQYSVVPLYRDIARKIGVERMSAFLARFEYGNQDISSGVDRFWLNGSIKISAVAQVQFLQKFYDQSLKVSPKTTALVKEILIQEKTDRYILSAKSGAGGLGGEGGKALGWYVGYVEREDRVFFFAMNIEGKSFQDILAPRQQITKSILKDMKIID